MRKSITVLIVVAFFTSPTTSNSQTNALTSFTPTQNAQNVAKNTNITLTFNTDINPSTITNSTIKINGSLSGLHSSAVVYIGPTKTATITPSVQFKIGEVVTVTLTRGIKTLAGDSLSSSYSWQFMVKPNINSGYFQTGPAVGVGSYPWCLAAADLDGNGSIDMAVANSSSGNVSILKNDGLGNFTQSSTISVGSSPRFIIASDFDVDGDIDLASANYSSNTVSILMNNGSGVFSLNSSVTVGNNPNGIAVADIDGEGDLDLIISNLTSNTISILKNNGTGSFVLTSTINVGSNPVSVQAADLSGDGKIDLVVSNNGSSTLSVLLNNNDGTFTISPVNSVVQPGAIAILDADGDGENDIAVAKVNLGTISIFKNNGSGSFTQFSNVTVGSQPSWIRPVDIDGNGTIDLAVSNNYSNNVSIIKNDGTGSFTQISTISTGNYPVSGIAADMDNDGLMDLAVANTQSNSISMIKGYFNNVTLRASPSPSYFGTVLVGSSTSQYLYLYNDGTDSSLNVSSIVSSSNNFTINKTSLTIPALGCDSVLITFSPTKVEFTYDDSLLLESNDLQKPHKYISLRGYGTSTTLFQGLVAWYPCNGNLQDVSWNGNDGTNHGTTLTSDRFEKNNSAYQFSTCGYVSIPEMLTADCAAFTFTAWVKQDYKDNNNHMIIFHGSIKGEAALNIAGGKIGFGANLYVPGTSNSTQNWYSANTTDTLKAGTYYFIVGRYIKGQKLDLMINGLLAASVTSPNLNMLTNPTRSTSAIGLHTQSGFTQSYCWNGVIDDIKIYSRAISDQEVLTLYHENGWNANAAPAAPLSLTASASSSQIILKWNKNTEADFLKYRIYMGSDSLNLSLKDSTSNSITDTTKIITGLTNGTLYYFRVSALDSGQLESPKSFAVSGIPNAIVVKMDTAYVSSNGANITVFLTVQNFANIGSITLTIGYNNTILTYLGLDTPPTGTLDNTDQGNILIGWQNILPLSKNNGDHLLGLKFTYNGGLGIEVVSALSFMVSSCEITDALGTTLSISYIDGGVKFITGVKLSGTVQYYGANKTPVSNALITLTTTSGAGRSKVSAADGTYRFDSLSTGLYTLTASKTGTWGGVTGGDALLVARHAAGLSLLSETPLLAADVNASGTITGGDALLILQRAVGLDQTFTAGDWVFSPQTVTVSGTNVTTNISALVMGDVNASYSPSPGTVFARSNGSISLNTHGKQNVSPTGTFEIPILGSSDMSLGAVSLKINFPSELVDFMGASSLFPGLVSHADTRSLTIVWVDLSGKTPWQFKLNEPLVSLKFSPKVHSGTVALTIDPWSELTDAQGEMNFNAILSAPTVEITDRPTTFSLGQNYPNPFNPSTIIAYELPKDVKVSIKVFNSLGQHVITLVDGFQSSGHHEVTCETKFLPSGIYFYQMTAESFSQTKKMIVMK